MAVGSAALVLATGGTVMLRGALEHVTATARLYPETRALALGVASVGVVTPEGTFLRSGFHRAGRAGSPLAAGSGAGAA